VLNINIYVIYGKIILQESSEKHVYQRLLHIIIILEDRGADYMNTNGIHFIPHHQKWHQMSKARPFIFLTCGMN